MPKGLLFWIVMVVWLLVGVWGYWPAGGAAPAYGPLGWGLVLFVLVGLLGWQVFGPPLRG